MGYRFQITFVPYSLIFISLCTVFAQPPSHSTFLHVLKPVMLPIVLRIRSKLSVASKSLVGRIPPPQF